MTTDGGGWTRVSLTIARQSLGGAMKVHQGSANSGFDAYHRPWTRDGSGEHSARYTINYAPGYSAFYLSGYAARANAGSSYKSDMNASSFFQKTWSKSHGSSWGDISFGSPADAGPVTSFARFAKSPGLQCQSCTVKWTKNNTIYKVSVASTVFRMDWGEGGSEHEGWYPWWSGYIYLR